MIDWFFHFFFQNLVYLLTVLFDKMLRMHLLVRQLGVASLAVSFVVERLGPLEAFLNRERETKKNNTNQSIYSLDHWSTKIINDIFYLASFQLVVQASFVVVSFEVEQQQHVPLEPYLYRNIQWFALIDSIEIFKSSNTYVELTVRQHHELVLVSRPIRSIDWLAYLCLQHDQYLNEIFIYSFILHVLLKISNGKAHHTWSRCCAWNGNAW